ncbi:MAG: penicillin-binding transpeptidase domain-containing protein [Patescibacteria group bacterium]
MRPSYNLEEILNQRVADDELMEVPLANQVFKLVFAAASVLALIGLGRLFFLNAVQSAFYKEKSFHNANQIIYKNPARGVIFDRFGKPLVQNETVFNAVLTFSKLPKIAGERVKIFEQLAIVLKMPFKSLLAIINETDFEKTNYIVLGGVDNPEQAVELRKLEYAGVQVEEDYSRFYPDSEIFSHILGYIGAVSETDLAENNNLLINDRIGKTGLESYYDASLRGHYGITVKLRNVKGEVFDEKTMSLPKSGESLITNIDAEFQKKFYSAMLNGLRRVGSRSGSGLAINPQNGEVLALLSFPGFDGNDFSRNQDSVEKIFTNKFQPLFNRVVSGVYNPGSTIKPLVAAAALNEKIINTDKEIFSSGAIEIPNPYYPDKPSRFLDWKAHGWVNLYSALARSSNVYFYSIGGGFGDVSGLGIARLKKYWQKFGFGEKTGIDLAGEKQGFLPDPDSKKNSRWLLGDTYNVSIGQGDLLITPLQLLDYIAAIASKGFIYEPHVAQKPAKISVDLSDFKEIFGEVEKGMIDAVKKQYGTAYLLNNLAMTTAAKTGSAQIQNNTKVNAFFVGYGPVPNPQIAILILVEDAKEGSLNAVPIAKEVLSWYYENRVKTIKYF